MSEIQIFTDGSSRGNPGPGGYGAILIFGGQRKELSEGFRKTTNNRMELMAVCAALEKIKATKYPVTVYSDSKYVIDSITKGWVFGWVKKNFKDKKNKDLWLRYLQSHSRFNIKFVWVKVMPDIKKMSVVMNWPFRQPCKVRIPLILFLKAKRVKLERTNTT